MLSDIIFSHKKDLRFPNSSKIITKFDEVVPHEKTLKAHSQVWDNFWQLELL